MFVKLIQYAFLVSSLIMYLFILRKRLTEKIEAYGMIDSGEVVLGGTDDLKESFLALRKRDEQYLVFSDLIFFGNFIFYLLTLMKLEILTGKIHG
jgi:hypothetical protein